MNTKSLWLAALACAMTLGMTVSLSGCEKKGPIEQAGEEVDEAVDTMKNGGKESTSSKLDDAGDKLQDAAEEAKDAVTK